MISGWSLFQRVIYIYIFSIWVFFHKHSRFTGQQAKGEGIYLTSLYHFHPLHRRLDISRAIAAESSPLHIAGSRTRTGFRAQVANHQATRPSYFGVFYTKSAPCLVWCPYIFCSWTYVFYLSHDLKIPLHWGVMHIYGWELLTASLHPGKFGGYRHSDN